MSPSPPRAKELFLASLRMLPDQWDAYLHRVCGEDNELRGRVKELLNAHVAAASAPELPNMEFGGIDEPTEFNPGSGTVIGPYKLLQQIGEGGMGVVFMAEQSLPVRRRVAIKVIKPGMDSRQVIARFEAERQALAMMDHVNIARVLDVGMIGEFSQRPPDVVDAGDDAAVGSRSMSSAFGRPYFVMELVDGVPITQYCDDNRLTPRERLELFMPVCQAIHHAHQKGIIHRDIKPSNVMVTDCEGQRVPKVIDFGMAKAMEQNLIQRSLFTRFGTIVGTLEYMSPEQAAMSSQGVDTRSDIYALGVLLYELMTGGTPLKEQLLKDVGYAEILRVIKEEDPPKPSTTLCESCDLPAISANRRMDPVKLTKLVRGELDWIVMKCLEKDRSRRYETARDFALDVQRYLNNEAVFACPPSASYRLRKIVRRNKGPLLAVSLVMLAFASGIIGTSWGMLRATQARAKAVYESQLKENALKEAEDKLWLSLFERARAGRFSHQMGHRLESLAALSDAARIRPDERLRDEAIAAMVLPDVRVVSRSHISRTRDASTVAYGGHYRLYARATDDGILTIRNIDDDVEVRRIDAGPIPPGDNLYFSPDERFLLLVGENHPLRVWRMPDGQPVLRDKLHGCNHPSFSPDGRYLAVGQQEWVICFDLETDQETNRWRTPSHVCALAYHPESNRLAVGYLAANVSSIYDSEHGTLVSDLRVGAMNSQVVAWHPDGQRLAIGGSDPEIQIWNVTTKRRVATLVGHAQNVTELTFHPEGEVLASHSWDGTLRLWESATGRPLLQMPLLVSDRPRFSRDGRWLAAVRYGERARLLEFAASHEYVTLVGSSGAGQDGYGSGDISLDGHLLAVGMDDGARLFDIERGREIAKLPARTVAVAFERGYGPRMPDCQPKALLTGGANGLLRWPITREDSKGNCLRLGPPEQLSPLTRAVFARSPDGHTLAAATEEWEGVNTVLDLANGKVQRNLGRHPSGNVHALSGDGSWAASCGWHSDVVRLWSIDTGEIVHEWKVGQRALVSFSPDSRALIISRDDEFSFHDVSTLKPIRRLVRDVSQFPGHVAFSPDGRLMAMEMSPAVIHLKEATTGRTVAKLEDPHGDRGRWQYFSPDGTKLVVVSNLAHAIHVWDLRAIRTRLKEMNLDWDWPEFSPVEDHVRPADSPCVSVVKGDRFTNWTTWRDVARKMLRQ